MTTREGYRNDRIATRYLFGETAVTLARDYGICQTRVRQVLAAHLQHSRREFYRQFGQWPDDLHRRPIRLRLLHLMNQYRVRTGLPPLSSAVLRNNREADGPQWRGGAGPLKGEAAASPRERTALDLNLRAADMRRKYAHVHEDE